eukprot:g10540.t1
MATQRSRSREARRDNPHDPGPQRWVEGVGHVPAKATVEKIRPSELVSKANTASTTRKLLDYRKRYGKDLVYRVKVPYIVKPQEQHRGLPAEFATDVRLETRGGTAYHPSTGHEVEIYWWVTVREAAGLLRRAMDAKDMHPGLQRHSVATTCKGRAWTDHSTTIRYWVHEPVGWQDYFRTVSCSCVGDLYDCEHFAAQCGMHSVSDAVWNAASRLPQEELEEIYIRLLAKIGIEVRRPVTEAVESRWCVFMNNSTEYGNTNGSSAAADDGGPGCAGPDAVSTFYDRNDYLDPEGPGFEGFQQSAAEAVLRYKASLDRVQAEHETAVATGDSTKIQAAERRLRTTRRTVARGFDLLHPSTQQRLVRDGFVKPKVEDSEGSAARLPSPAESGEQRYRRLWNLGSEATK